MSRTEPRAGAAASEDARRLYALAAEHEVTMDDGQARALLGFGQLLLTWNARINLTGARSMSALIESHLPDAFALARLLPAPAHVIDVGSGGGLPALPLALLRPTLAVDLCESIAKKVAFLRTAVRDLGLGGRLRVHATRAETLVATQPGRFDVAISRAAFPPAEWLALGQRLVVPGGRVLALTTPAIGGDVASPGDLRHPYLGGERIVIERDVPRETSPPGATGAPAR